MKLFLARIAQFFSGFKKDPEKSIKEVFHEKIQQCIRLWRSIEQLGESREVHKFSKETPIALRDARIKNENTIKDNQSAELQRLCKEIHQLMHDNPNFRTGDQSIDRRLMQIPHKLFSHRLLLSAEVALFEKTMEKKPEKIPFQTQAQSAA